MIKKIVILALAVFTLAVPLVGANDGGVAYDDDKLLTFSFSTEQTEVEIGGEFVFNITMTNRTEYPVYYIRFNKIFGELNYFGYIDIEYDSYEYEVGPYQTVTYKITYTIPEDIDWYKVGDKYYADLKPALEYGAIDTYYEDGEKTNWEWDFLNTSEKSIPIEITNLYDGSECVNISILDKVNTLVYELGEESPSFIYGSMLSANLQTYLSVKNTSDYEISNVQIRLADILHFENGEQIEYMAPNDDAVVLYGHILYRHREEIERDETIQYMVLCKIGEDYYANSTLRTYNTVVFDDYYEQDTTVITEDEDMQSVIVDYPYPIYTTTPVPTTTPVLQPTPEIIQETIIKTEVIQEYIIPFWVWIVLGASIIGLGIALYTTYTVERNKKDTEDRDD